MKNKRAYCVTGAAVLCAALLFGMAASGCSDDNVNKVTGVALNTTELYMEEGHTASLRASVATADGTEYYGNVSWSSSDETVATVSSGIVTAVAEGEAVVSVEVPGTECSADCAVSVHGAELNVFTVGIKDDVEDFGYFNPNSIGYEGMEVELGQMLGDALGYAEVEYVPLSAQEREDALNDGTVDCVIATYSITAERRDLVNFSASYYTDYVRALALGSYAQTLDPCSIASIPEALAGGGGGVCTVGTDAGTTAYDAFTDYCMANDIAMKDATGNDIFANKEYQSYAEAEAALESGEIDLFVGDYSILSGYRSGQDVFLEDLLEAQEYGVATALGSPLTDSINALIDEWLADGMMDALLASYGLEHAAAAAATAATAAGIIG